MTEMKLIEKRAVSDLKEHPDQRYFVGDLSEGELYDLIDSIGKSGLHHPIEITPDDIIVAGHQRLRAVKHLGWAEVDVIVRHDLADAGEDAIVAYLIEDNLHRRQMDPLAIARAYRHLKTIERERDYDDLHPDDRKEIRDRVAQRLGSHYSGRTLDRYEQILDMPRAVQDAVIGKTLPLTLAVKITKLLEAEKQEIAGRIDAGEPAKDVVNQYLPSSKSSGNSGSQNDHYAVYRRVVDSLNEGLEVLPHLVEDVAGVIAGGDTVIDVLERGEDLLRRLREAEIAFREGAFDAFDDDEDAAG